MNQISGDFHQTGEDRRRTNIELSVIYTGNGRDFYPTIMLLTSTSWYITYKYFIQLRPNIHTDKGHHTSTSGREELEMTQQHDRLTRIEILYLQHTPTLGAKEITIVGI